MAEAKRRGSLRYHLTTANDRSSVGFYALISSVGEFNASTKRVGRCAWSGVGDVDRCVRRRRRSLKIRIFHRRLAARQASGSGPKVDAATAGELKGAVALNGSVPKNEAIKMNADPVCVKEAKGTPTQETYIVSADGKSLGNVFVYVKDGLGNYSYDPPTPVSLNQQGCHYMPHVFGIRVGQPLEIINSDPTLHNIHAMPKTNREFNNGQPIQGMKTTHTFTAKEVMVPFKCDVHGWMNAYVGVLDHPFFAVTDAEGKFDIKGLPPGTYTIEAWHEKLGAVTQSVTIGAERDQGNRLHDERVGGDDDQLARTQSRSGRIQAGLQGRPPRCPGPPRVCPVTPNHASPVCQVRRRLHRDPRSRWQLRHEHRLRSLGS